ncbi:hypothetical protein SNS2_4124 [Streptomyces netropsis]|nr:hypothetical protein SNS2_4124 [Streptomyces netropsis]
MYELLEPYMQRPGPIDGNNPSIGPEPARRPTTTLVDRATHGLLCYADQPRGFSRISYVAMTSSTLMSLKFPRLIPPS